jgi:hypothetical protein
VTNLLNNLNLARPNVPLPTFSGRNNEKSFQAFVKEFNRIGNASGWNEASSTQILPSCLRGEAAAIYENLSDAEKINWRTLLDSLAQKLAGTNDIVSTFRRQANNKKQKVESLSEFAENVKELKGIRIPLDSRQRCGIVYLLTFLEAELMGKFGSIY